jgi:DNA-binding NarL/FixJ family response regulator
MASPQKYPNGQTPSEGTARAVGAISDGILHAAGRVDPASERRSPVTHEKQSAVGAGGKDFGLTPRERQVIVFVVAGYTKKAVAQKLGVSTQAIKHHIANIFDKLAVSNRLQLLLFALHHRLIDDVQGFPQSHRTPHKVKRPCVRSRPP